MGEEGGGSWPISLQIYFTGFSDDQLNKLHKMINLGGGVRFVHSVSVCVTVR